MISTEELLDTIRGDVLLGESMKEHTSLRIGGCADFFVDPLDPDDLCRAISLFESRNLPFTLVGRGTNLLVHDDGVRGAVILTKRALGRHSFKKNTVTAGAGVSLAMLAEKTFSASLGGIEMLQGIPGTLGGAVVMNAGAYGQEIGDVVSWVEVYDQGKSRVIPASDIEFGYRQSSLEDYTVLGSGLKLKKLAGGERDERAGMCRDALEKRAVCQPLFLPNAGSIFRNPVMPGKSHSGLTAGQMIDACGLKGIRRGGAMISDVHANIIINTGDAKAAEVFELICHVKDRVWKMFGVALELEIKLLGYEKTLC